jgi:hypothetical protein
MNQADLVRALQALPPGDQYLPSWCAIRYLRHFASPLHKAILKALDVPEEKRHGLWSEMARKFKINRENIYRHREKYLLPEITRLTMIFTLTFLLIHQQWADAEKIFSWLKNLRQ